MSYQTFHKIPTFFFVAEWFQKFFAVIADTKMTRNFSFLKNRTKGEKNNMIFMKQL